MKYDLSFFCEIDKYAAESYCAVHHVNKDKNLGDITKVDENNVPEFNVAVGASPCQDFSIAGKQEGAVWKCLDCGHEYNPLEVHYTQRYSCPHCRSKNIEKTRSSLIVEWLRFIYAKKPKFAVYENVKNLVGKKFKSGFNLFVKELEEYGYNVYWKVLNAKDYGVPQSRERVYCVIIRKDLDNEKFKFPEPIHLKKYLYDLLEDNVDDKYYLSKKSVESLTILPPHEISKTIRTSGRGSLEGHLWDIIREK